MKKIILLAAIFIASLKGFSQENKNCINVTGINQVAIAPTYTAKMMVSLQNVYYDSQISNLEEIKSGYMDKLTKAGIKSSSIKIDQLYYDLMGYDKKGLVIEFQTPSIIELQKFLNIRSLGVRNIENKYKVEFTEEQLAEYAKGAFDNAKKKALSIAKKLDKNIGSIIYLTDNNANTIEKSWHDGSSKNLLDYSISVSFELL